MNHEDDWLTLFRTAHHEDDWVVPSEEVTDDWVFYMREFISGCIGGWATAVVGQPFDTIKVRIQTQDLDAHVYKGAWDCFKKLIKTEGPLALYKGITAPFVGNGLCLCLQFGFDGTMKKVFRVMRLGLPYLVASGMVGGVAQCVVLIPMEHIRIRMQIQTGIGTDSLYKSTSDCFFKILKEHGWTRGLYKGTWATLLREGPPNGVYFTTYELACRYFTPPGKTRKDLSHFYVGISGALAGYAFWLVCYPFDVIKSRIQGDSFTHPHYKGIIDCFKQTKRHGYRSFFEGLTTCLLRAGPANATGFIGFEYTMSFLARHDPHY